MYLAALGCGIATYVLALLMLQPDDSDLTVFPKAMFVGRSGVHVVSYLLVVRLQARRRGPCGAP